MPTILIIDDNDDFRAYMQALLERQGYAVLSLRSARGLGIFVRDQHIDAVVTDLYMPEVDGLEVVSFFNRYDPQLPVFGVTGSAEEANSICIKAMNTFGAREVFTKPLDSASLLAALGRALKHPTEDAQGVLAFDFEDEQDLLTW